MTLMEMLVAAEQAAVTIYHTVVSTGQKVAEWETSGDVAPLVDEAVTAANGLLARMGVATSAKQAVTAPDIHTALKKIAAADPTVASGDGFAVLHGVSVKVENGVADAGEPSPNEAPAEAEPAPKTA